MEPPSIFSKPSPPHDHDPGKSPASGVHLEESTSTKSASPKVPQENPREVKLEVYNSPGRKISELLQGKEEEWTAVARKSGPLRLLDLPLDLLREILREVNR